ncbi:tyrosine-type recombinase/integrase [Streptomyces sp. NPDC058255]|uniref:tyrosine-type recombinase/integrase n=1 Tax=Streptomyces sp. NPDC058255 TaxID=3346407 RepID=UPI0036E175AA
MNPTVNVDVARPVEPHEVGNALEWEPRVGKASWWQTRQSRESLVERLLGLFTDPGAGLTRDKTRRRGLGKLLDWLEGQPGETWQDRWMASGADDAGFEWTDLPLQGRGTPKSHWRDELSTGLVLLVAGQAIRPSYPWLLRQRALRIEGRRSVEQIVDGYGIECRAVRDLLVEYLTERAPELDHVSLRSIARKLCRLFWRDLEIHHPGIDSLRLAPEVAQAWKERLAYIRDAQGHPVRPRVNFRGELVFVRAFYQDIARWAADDPARWAPWAAPCPVKANECATKKSRPGVKSRMDQRTRTQLPLLPALLRAVDRQRKDAEARITAARATPVGERFLVAGEEFERCRSGQAGRVYATEVAVGRRRNLTHEEEAAFWSWATVEVLRHTGIRIEEMLELTHHSFIAYTLPTTGEVVPMLQVAPSKTDAERLLLVSPELAEVLTAVIYRVRAGDAALPLVSAYDVFEQTWSPPMPFLFQRRYGTEDRPLTRSYIRECLVTTSQSAQITVAGDPLEWRPHDFRRIFVTDAIRSGLPPHIAAKICGHAALDTTMGYAAIYPEDVVSHHRAFIARRRTERPSEEYRELTATEWNEFLAHFELRKVALGTCGRDYATPCQHENACVRCPLLLVDPAQMPRLQEIHANLVDRLQEARDQGWLGEVAAIETTMAAAAQKLEVMRERAAQASTVHLGMPDFRRNAGRSSAEPETPLTAAGPL